jgi:predicted porin
MKRVLLGTTALVAAGIAMADAKAADPVSLGVGGYYRTAIGAIFDDEDGVGEGGFGRHDYFHEQDVEVHFTGKTTLDNGLTVGVNVQLEGQTQAGDQIDETWAYVNGSWGELRIGDEDDIAKNWAVIAPQVNLFGPTTPYFQFSNAGATAGNALGSSTNFIAFAFNNDFTKLYYSTPEFNGFKLGISYAPDGTQDRRSNPNNDGCFGCGQSDQNAGGLEDLWSIAAAYDGEFSEVTIGLSAGYSKAVVEGKINTATATALQSDPEAYGFGINLGWNAWTLGGSWQELDTEDDSSDYEVWDVGVTYGVGAWTLGLGFSQSDSGEAAAVQGDINSVLAIEASYAMGPGISISAGLGYNDFENNTAGGTGQDYSAVSGALGMSVKY